MDLFLQSLKDGVRKYQGPSLADDIARFIADNSRHRDMLRQHSVELAAARENDLKVINARGSALPDRVVAKVRARNCAQTSASTGAEEE